MPTTVDQLLADPPLVHRVGETALTHGLVPPALKFLEQTVQPGWRTLETGSGLSTVVFAMRGAQHTCVTPDPDEPGRIKAWCAERDIDAAELSFLTAPSERVLPCTDLGELDLVLVDGSHAFPQAFIDWYYTQDALKVGGLMLIDDVHLWTGVVLRDHLKAEPEWELVESWWGRTVAFRKVAPAVPGKDWPDQPYIKRKTGPDPLLRAKLAFGMLRSGETGEVGRRLRAAVRGETVDPHQDRRS